MKFPILRAAMVLPGFVFLLALGLRVAWILCVPSKPVGDFAMYLESAAHLLEHGEFDDQFIYMPGYVLLIAGIQALGGGWLAVKLAAAVLAAAGAPLVYALGKHLWNPSAAAIAGVLYAIWPGGIAVASVTGTDIPAAVMVAAGTWAFARTRREGTYRGSFAAGTLLGMAAWVRAVALPLAPLGVVLLWAKTRSLRRAAVGAACATAAATLVLAPWAVRNHQHYGEWFLTDSHGGLTALVGAYPNTDGQFTRALNRSFEAVTGISWLGKPHRQADRLAYDEARRWTRFEPWYAVGLGLMRADKLLSNERSLLYWPLYREGVLTPDHRAFFDRWRPEIEIVTDVFWWFLVFSCLAAVPLALATRNAAALGVLPMQAALAGVYVMYFAESRYHLPIAVLAFPGAAGFWAFAFAEVKALRPRLWSSSPSHEQSASRRTFAWVAVTLTGIVALGWGARAWSVSLLQRHRWAVHVCEVEGQSRFCLWQRGRQKGSGPSPLRGAFSDVGLRLSEGMSSAQLDVILAAGRHTFMARPHLQAPAIGDVGGNQGPAVRAQISLYINEQMVFQTWFGPDTEAPPGRQDTKDSLEPWAVHFDAIRGTNRILLRVNTPGSSTPVGSLWLEHVRIAASS